MNMKINIVPLIAFLLFVNSSIAENQGEDMGLGSGVTHESCYVNDAQSNIASGDGKSNFKACHKTGTQYVDPIVQTVTSSNALTVTAGAYTAGVDMGGKVTMTSAGRAGANSLTIQSVTISDRSTTAKNRTVIIFNANPTSTTFTDNSALTINDADIPKIACVIPLTAHQSFADNSVSTSNNVGCAVDLAAGTSMYATVIAAENQTPGSINDLTLGISFYQD